MSELKWDGSSVISERELLIEQGDREQPVVQENISTSSVKSTVKTAADAARLAFQVLHWFACSL